MGLDFGDRRVVRKIFDGEFLRAWMPRTYTGGRHDQWSVGGSKTGCPQYFG